jgi:hypothetical protein
VQEPAPDALEGAAELQLERGRGASTPIGRIFSTIQTIVERNHAWTRVGREEEGEAGEDLEGARAAEEEEELVTTNQRRLTSTRSEA